MCSPGRTLLRFVLLFWLMAYGPAVAMAQQAATSESVTRSLVHVLDYMAADYPVAVADGQIINETEYAEMTGFARSAALLLEDMVAIGALDDADSLRSALRGLAELVDRRADPEDVAVHARSIRNSILANTSVLSSPQTWPDLASGERIYSQYCTQCHGSTGAGNGAIAADLDPAPAILNSGDRIASISPFQAYNTIRLGVDGTSMLAFPTLSDSETWDVAFYVKSLKASNEDGAGETVNPGSLPVTLEDVAMKHDADLERLLTERGASNPGATLAAIRTHQPTAVSVNGLALAREALTEALAEYRAGNVAEARQHALRAYLEGIEPMEPAIGARDGTFLIELESRMMDVRSDIENDAGIDAVSESVARAQATIRAAQDVLDANRGSLWFSFVVAASILLREGLEAFLIILAILSVLKAADQARASRWVHAGWLAAVGVGIVGWFFSDMLLEMGAAQREIMEGVIALVAVAVLMYVGLWLHSMTESKKWRAFIEDRIMRKLGTGSLFGLASIAFFAVFREAFESVLFLSALSLEQGGEHKLAVIGGAVAAMALILGLAPVALRRSVRLPIRELFRYSSFVMGFLCVVLAGKGIHALQEAGIVSVSVLRTSIRFDLLGVYPSMETMVTQVAILLTLVLAISIPRMFASRVTR